MVKTKVSQTAKVKQSSFYPRPPVVAVLGHIDHGKTTLLDFIRKENIAQKEAGGITQHIGAYQAKIKIGKNEKLITFIDTPGHEAFSKMRSRGAQVADIALLVISVKDGVMPQTKESIDYIKEAKIPMIIAINKIDVFSAKSGKTTAIKKIEKQLKKLGVVVEKEGGDVVCLPISAKTGENVNNLLEMIILVAEMKEIKSKKSASLEGVIIDSQLDRQRGVLATVLVRKGNLKIRDSVKVEGIRGKVKALFDEYGKKVETADPSKPVQVLGFEKAPPIGGIASLITKKARLTSLPSSASSPKQTLDERFINENNEDEKLRIVLKTDTLGTKEAILAALKDKAIVISSGIGDISESDVFLAKTAKAPILGFNIVLSSEIERLAQNERVKIKTYDIIYRLLEEVEDIIDFLKEKKQEKVLGRAEVIAQFESKKKKIAGAKVLEGRIARGDKIKILRGEEEIGQGRIVTLRQGKDDITKIAMGEQCGIGFSKKLDFEVGDIVKSIG